MKKSTYINISLIILLIVLIILVKYDILAFFDTLIYEKCTFFMNPVLTNVFKVITFFGSTVFIVIASIILFIFLLKMEKRRALTYLGSIVFAMSTSSILKIIIKRPRPNILPLVLENTYSFPSGHTIAITTLVGYTIYLLCKKKGKLSKTIKTILISMLSLLAILVMISRIYLGAHYFTDILGGIICALIALNTSIYIYEKTTPLPN